MHLHSSSRLDAQQVARIEQLARRTCEYLGDQACAILMDGVISGGVGEREIAEASRGPYGVLHFVVSASTSSRVRCADCLAEELPLDAWPDPREWRMRRV